jgi:hypothetical protein
MRHPNLGREDMHGRGSVFGLVLALCCLPTIILQRAAAQNTSTSEERTQWVETTHKLESNPLDAAVNKQGELALQRLSEVQDVAVPFCPALLGEFNGMKSLRYRYAHVITRQYMLASAAFLIENPGKASDTEAMNLSAVGSVLKMYQAILQNTPDARIKSLDDLVKDQDQGKLKESIQRQCH